MRPTALRLTRGARLLRPQPALRAPLLSTHALNLQPSRTIPRPRAFSHFAPRCADKAPGKSTVTYEVAELSDGEYHELSDYYLDLICTKYEDLQDMREDVDVEFAAGVLTIAFPSIGTYVINKQPPNKQIWLSSPLSGPKRYDYVFARDSQNKTEVGNWLYMRDHTSLHDVLMEETGVDLEKPIGHADQ